MKVSLEHKEINLVFETPDVIEKDAVQKIISAFYDTLEHVVAPTPVLTENPWKTSNIPIMSASSVQQKKERPFFRDRLPNNVINVEDLDVKQAVTEEALVRCPHCGQSHVLIIDGGTRAYWMRKFYSTSGNSEEFKIVGEFDSIDCDGVKSICCKPETDRKAYFEDMQTTTMQDDKDFIVNNNTKVFCPVCCETADFLIWKEAYDNPLKFFETEYLCDACGGEKVEKLIKNDVIYECDKCKLQSSY